MNETNDLESDIARVKKDLSESSAADISPKQTGAKKVAKKVKKVAKTVESKKAPKKLAKKPNGSGAAKHVDADNLITVADLATEADISPQAARVKLRAADLDRGDGRWKWEEGSKTLKEARKILGLSY